MTAPPSSTPTPGQVLAGRYELLGVIGRGGHGLVWRARDRETDRLVAVKMLTDVAAKDPQQIERLRREQNAMVALAGTSAVQFHDLCLAGGNKLCLVMELLDGIDLERRLEQLEGRGEHLPLAELERVLAPIVSTLERAHQVGILHRDLKPANIFLVSDAAGGVRLLDFGLAKLRSAMPLTATGTIVGSPSYIAPEIWKGVRDGLDQRIDVYSFGVLVFRCLSGKVPFEGGSLKDKFLAATTAPRPSLRALRPDLPPELDEWVDQVLAIDPELRFRTVRGAWSALGVLLGFAQAPPPRPAPAAPKRESSSSSIEIPMAGALSKLGAAWRLANQAVKKLAESVQTRPAPAVRSPAVAPPVAPPVPAPAPKVAAPPMPRREGSMVKEWLAGSEYRLDPPEPPPAPSERPAVSVARVVAVMGTPAAPAEGEKSMVHEWLAGSEMDVPERETEDVVSWLGGDSNEDEPARPPKKAARKAASKKTGKKSAKPAAKKAGKKTAKKRAKKSAKPAAKKSTGAKKKASRKPAQPS